MRVTGIDETSLKRRQDYVTVAHDLEAKRLLFMTAGRRHDTVRQFKEDLSAHGGNPDDIAHVCMDMSAAYTNGVGEVLPQAHISYDRFHVIALANAATNAARRDEILARLAEVRATLVSENVFDELALAPSAPASVLKEIRRSYF